MLILLSSSISPICKHWYFYYENMLDIWAIVGKWSEKSNKKTKWHACAIIVLLFETTFVCVYYTCVYYLLQTEQMYTLLSICLVLHPQRIDEAIQSTLREKALADKIARMAVSFCGLVMHSAMKYNNNNHIFGRNGTYIQNIYIKFIFTALSYQAIKLLPNNFLV